MQRFAQLGVAAELGSFDSEDPGSARALGLKFIDAVKEMNAEMAIPTAVQGMGAADVTAVATQAMKEAHGNMFEFGDQPMKYLLDIGYPVPKWMSHEECEAIVRACVAVEVAEPVAEPVPVRSRL